MTSINAEVGPRIEVEKPAQTAIGRRTAITAMLAAATASVLGTKITKAAGESLAAAAASDGRFFGSAARIDDIRAQRDLRVAVLRECSWLIPEVEMYWKSIELSHGQFFFDKMDALTAFATENGKKVRGHTLLWHLGTPDWAARQLRERKDWNLIAKYFGTLIPRYRGVIGQWNVVNEPIDVGHRQDGLRESVFLEAFGPGYIGRALTQARIFAPRAQLIINEYGLEYDFAEERERRYFLLKLLERLRHENAPLDGLGLQGHLDLRKGNISQSAIADFLQEVADMGLFIDVTELDVTEADRSAPLVERDRLVADEVSRYLEVVLSQPNVRGVTTWGLTDRRSWLNGNGPALNRGLPFDASMQPTSMYFAIREAFGSAAGSSGH